MLTLTPDENDMRRRLIATAVRGKLLTYEELWNAVFGTAFRVAGGFRRIAPMLYHIATYEDRLGRPMLTSVVVGTAGIPGEGFYKAANELGYSTRVGDTPFWEDRLDEVRAFWAFAIPNEIVTARELEDWHEPDGTATLTWDPTALPDRAALALLAQLRKLR